METLIEASSEEAKEHFLKGSSYFNGDFPSYISFEPILDEVQHVLAGSQYSEYQKKNPSLFPDVNYGFVTNKDGRFAWRPIELMHPAIYVSLAALLCEEENWTVLKSRFAQFKDVLGVECCSLPVMSMQSSSTDQANQVKSWWQKVEQKSLALSLEYTHVLHTDVTDCYGSLYTHSIAWALHGVDEAKAKKGNRRFLGFRDSFTNLIGWECDIEGLANGICFEKVLVVDMEPVRPREAVKTANRRQSRVKGELHSFRRVSKTS